MRLANALMLAAAVAAAGCAADGPPAEAEAPPGGSNPEPLLFGVAIGAALIILLIANSGLSPSPDPPG
ncbi:MAG TPA: hypothetical protein VFN28_00895 [Amaricoccus sp.]|nr:hypothetical protein [Amaricoccus sp.]